MVPPSGPHTQAYSGEWFGERLCKIHTRGDGNPQPRVRSAETSAAARDMPHGRPPSSFGIVTSPKTASAAWSLSGSGDAGRGASPEGPSRWERSGSRLASTGKRRSTYARSSRVVTIHRRRGRRWRSHRRRRVGSARDATPAPACRAGAHTSAGRAPGPPTRSPARRGGRPAGRRSASLRVLIQHLLDLAHAGIVVDRLGLAGVDDDQPLQGVEAAQVPIDDGEGQVHARRQSGPPSPASPTPRLNARRGASRGNGNGAAAG